MRTATYHEEAERNDRSVESRSIARRGDPPFILLPFDMCIEVESCRAHCITDWGQSIRSAGLKSKGDYSAFTGWTAK
jgi:hypothetical protein